MQRDNVQPDNPIQPGSPQMPLHTIKTIPNLITLFRLLLTIAFVFMYPHEEFRVVSIIIYIIAASTDWFDGQVARRFHQVSVFGKRFDPIMDRLLIFAGVLALVLTNQIPVWIVVFLIGRDVFLFLGGSVILKLTGSILDVVFIGKVCTFVLMTGFAIQLFGLFPVNGLGLFDVPWLPGFGSEPVSLGIWVIYVGCVLSFITACVYVYQGIRLIGESRSGQRK